MIFGATLDNARIVKEETDTGVRLGVEMHLSEPENPNDPICEDCGKRHPPPPSGEEIARRNFPNLDPNFTKGLGPLMEELGNETGQETLEKLVKEFSPGGRYVSILHGDDGDSLIENMPVMEAIEFAARIKYSIMTLAGIGSEVTRAMLPKVKKKE